MEREDFGQYIWLLIFMSSFAFSYLPAPYTNLGLVAFGIGFVGMIGNMYFAQVNAAPYNFIRAMVDPPNLFRYSAKMVQWTFEDDPTSEFTGYNSKGNPEYDTTIPLLAGKKFKHPKLRRKVGKVVLHHEWPWSVRAKFGKGRAFWWGVSIKSSKVLYCGLTERVGMMQADKDLVPGWKPRYELTWALGDSKLSERVQQMRWNTEELQEMENAR